MEKENEPPIKKRRLSLKSPSHSRFLYKSKEELETISKGFVPPNTAKNTRWARNCFLEWMYERNGLSDEKCPENILEEQCAADLNTWIPKFIAEARRSEENLRLSQTVWIAQLRMKIRVLKKKMGFHCFMAVQLDRYQFSLINVT